MAAISSAPPKYDELPVTPTREQWALMSPEQRLAFAVDAGQRLTEIARMDGEGRPHSNARARAMDVLRGHFDRLGRRIYVSSDLPVLYPGERVFAPDVFAVLDVADPGEQDTRMSWSVEDEGRGLDFVLEVLHGGDARKDLVSNLHFYARLGIPEYFVYDRRSERIVAHRLAPSGIYASIPSTLGRYPSAVLGLDLGVVAGRLRFYHGLGEIADSRELIEQLNVLVRGVEARADDERERANAERERANAERERAEGALDVLRQTIASLLAMRGHALDEQQRGRLHSCADPALLVAWLTEAAQGRVPSF